MPVQKRSNLSRKPAEFTWYPGSASALLMQERGQESHLETEVSQERRACPQNECSVRFSLN